MNEAFLAQSLVGSGDLSNDVVATFSAPTPAKIGFNLVNTPAPSSKMFSLVTEAVVQVPPGRHVVRAVASPPKARDDDYPISLASKTKWIGSRELIVVELLR